MAGRGPQSFKKRQKEQQRREKQTEKAARREERKVAPKPEEEELRVLDGPQLPEEFFNLPGVGLEPVEEVTEP